MWTDAITIFQKECGNLFKDRRAVFANFVLPLFLMPVMFVALGAVQGFQARSMAETSYGIIIEGTAHRDFLGELDKVLLWERKSPEEIKEDAQALKLIFPSVEASANMPWTLTVELDKSSQAGMYVLQKVREASSAFNKERSRLLLADKGLDTNDLEPLSIAELDLAKPEASNAGLMVLLLPYMLVLYLVTGPLGLAIQATAGEKEQGSLASLLVNQVSRTSIAIGKLLYVVVSGLLNALVSLVGIVLAIWLMAQLAGEGAPDIGLLAFSNPLNILALLSVMLVTSAMAASLLVALGAMAKNMKEASGYTMPVMLITMITGIATMNMDPAADLVSYMVPVLNSIFCIKLVLLGKIALFPVLITLAVNAMLGGVGLLLATRIYNSEKVLYTV